MPGMSLAKNLKHFRKERGLSQEKLAKLAQVSQQSISRLENEDDLTSKFLPAIARALGRSVYELDENFRPEDSVGHLVRVPLISWVAAGHPDTPEAVLEFEEAEKLTVVGLDPNGDWIALRVDGSSMNKISPPDSIIFVNRNIRRLTPNACYIITDAETGKASYKRFRPPNRFEPVSTEMEKHKKSIIIGSPRIIGRVMRSQIDM